MNQKSSKSEDIDLIKRVATGDKAAFQALFARHYTRLFRFIERQVGDPSLAEELANEVFLDAWRQAGRFEARSSVTTWLMAIARNKAISAIRKRRETPVDEKTILAIEDGADNSEVLVQKTSKAEALRAAIDSLSPDHKAVIDLAYYQELSIREVATVLDVPTNTVKTRMFHARKNLAQKLEAAGIDRGWP